MSKHAGFKNVAIANMTNKSLKKIHKGRINQNNDLNPHYRNNQQEDYI